MSIPGFGDPVVRQSSALDLARLVDQQTPLLWFEAVAIVQELCAVVLGARGAGSPAALELSDLFITSDGGVEVRGGGAKGVPTVPQVAHVLLALIAGTQALPVQVRLLALQEVSPTPGCATLREFSDRLAPFERPNRRHAIRDVYERFTQAPARDAVRSAPEPARARPAHASARPPWWRSRRVRKFAASVALLVAAGVAAVWLWGVVAPLLPGLDGRQKADAGPAAGEGSLSASDVERIWATARRLWSRTEARPAVPARDASPDAAPVIVAVPAGRADEPPAPKPGVTSLMTDAAALASTSVADRLLFSTVDADVVPPVLVRPHLPTIPRAGIRAEDLPQVEVVVSPKGEVESVKLVTQQAGVKPAMMMMAMKAWRFAPATRAGRPVRYRLVVPLTNQ